jgi:hypothetical protein
MKSLMWLFAFHNPCISLLPCESTLNFRWLYQADRHLSTSEYLVGYYQDILQDLRNPVLPEDSPDYSYIPKLSNHFFALISTVAGKDGFLSHDVGGVCKKYTALSLVIHYRDDPDHKKQAHTSRGGCRCGRI